MVEELRSRPSEAEFSLPDGDIRGLNTTVGTAIAEMVRTTLGPRGMDKMLVDRDGMVIVTNDGYTLLGQMNIDVDLVPAAKLLVELAQSQDEVVGDGTTTAVLLAGRLLGEAEALVERGVHPTTIAKGYHLAAERFRDVSAANAIAVEWDDAGSLRNVAQIAMSGVGSYVDDEVLAERVVSAARILAEDGRISEDNLIVEKVPGGTIADSAVSRGLLMDIQPVHVNMPRRVEPARIMCLTGPIKVKQPSSDLGDVVVRDADDYREMRAYEDRNLASTLAALETADVNVIFCSDSISKKAQRWLAERGIMAARRVSRSDVERLAQSTGALLAADAASIEAEDLGSADIVELRDCGGEDLLAIELGDDEAHASLVLRGGAEHALDEMERAVLNGLGALKAVHRDPRMVPGGGALEVEAAMDIREYADGVSGREQLAVRAFADALEAVPKTLAENAGLDPLDGVIELRQRHAEGNATVGIDAIYGRIDDVVEAGVVEPAGARERLVESATEVTNRILLIDDVLAARRSDDEDDD